jgi:SulP family sulfate permease
VSDGWIRFWPAWSWLSIYQKGWLRLDIIAGLTAAAVVIPKAMAYATIAGLPLQVGLYTAFAPMLIYAFFGTSRPMSVSTSSTIAILTGAALAEVAPNADPATLMTASVTLAFMVGLLLIVAGILRLGFTANFISEPVLTGFKAGIGIVIVVDQVPKILGVHFDKAGFFHNIGEILQALPHFSGATAAVGIGTIALLVLIEKFRPKWPAPIIAVGAAIALAAFFGWDKAGVELVGTIPTGLPTLLWPDLALMEALWPAAAGIALMSYAETAAVARAFAKTGEPFMRPNVELFATGMANVGGALFGAMSAGGGTSQTAVNRMAGAMTQVSGLVTALAALLTMFVFAPYIGYMPHATLAGIVIVYSIGLIEIPDFVQILRVRRTEFLWALAALAGVILLGTLQGILVAIIVSVVALASQTANPPVNVLGRIRGTNGFRPRSWQFPDDETFPGLLIVRPEGRMYFLNAERVAEKIRALREAEPHSVLLLDLRGVFDLEYSALKMLIDGARQQREQGTQLIIAAPNNVVREVLTRSTLGKELGENWLFHSLEAAVHHYSANFLPRPATGI